MFKEEYIFGIDKINNKIKITGFKRVEDSFYRVMSKEEIKEIIPNPDYYFINLLIETLKKVGEVIDLTSIKIERV